MHQIPQKEGKTTKLWKDIKAVTAFFKKKKKYGYKKVRLQLLLFWIGNSFKKTIQQQFNFESDTETVLVPLCLYYFQTVLG